jgi:hypothetical protein
VACEVGGDEEERQAFALGEPLGFQRRFDGRELDGERERVVQPRGFTDEPRFWLSQSAIINFGEFCQILVELTFLRYFEILFCYQYTIYAYDTCVSPESLLSNRNQSNSVHPQIATHVLINLKTY